MTFNSLCFVVFFATVFLLYQIRKSWRAQKLLLLGASYLFYSAWNPPFSY
jgi:alginate O-acetyltransferase complex protein AlgI